MDERDLTEFVEVMQDTCHLYGDDKTMSPGQLKMYFKVCAIWSLVDIRIALSAHVRDETRGRFFPKPADIGAQLKLLREDDGRPKSGEAWLLALKANDEAHTVVWTDEIATAFGAVKFALRQGDRFSARNAFVEIYERLVNEARNDGRPCNWHESLGHEPRLRKVAIEEAARLRRLPKPVVLALEHSIEEGSTPEALSQIERDHPGRRALRDWFEAMRHKADLPSDANAAERQRVQTLKTATQQKVDDYLARMTNACTPQMEAD